MEFEFKALCYLEACNQQGGGGCDKPQSTPDQALWAYLKLNFHNWLNWKALVRLQSLHFLVLVDSTNELDRSRAYRPLGSENSEARNWIQFRCASNRLCGLLAALSFPKNIFRFRIEIFMDGSRKARRNGSSFSECRVINIRNVILWLFECLMDRAMTKSIMLQMKQCNWVNERVWASFSNWFFGFAFN